jgi:hypothetical protein
MCQLLNGIGMDFFQFMEGMKASSSFLAINKVPSMIQIKK